MKLIQAMKSVKELTGKANDLRGKIAQHSAYLSVENPVYKDQAAQVQSWLDSHSGVVKEIEGLMVRISKTNLATEVEIVVSEVKVTKSITAWIARRKILAKLEQDAWGALTDRNLKEGQFPSTAGAEPTKVGIVRCYDPKARDGKISTFKWEPGEIDKTLEVVNATTELLD